MATTMVKFRKQRYDVSDVAALEKSNKTFRSMMARACDLLGDRDLSECRFFVATVSAKIGAVNDGNYPHPATVLYWLVIWPHEQVKTTGLPDDDMLKRFKNVGDASVVGLYILAAAAGLRNGRWHSDLKEWRRIESSIRGLGRVVPLFRTPTLAPMTAPGGKTDQLFGVRLARVDCAIPVDAMLADNTHGATRTAREGVRFDFEREGAFGQTWLGFDKSRRSMFLASERRPISQLIVYTPEGMDLNLNATKVSARGDFGANLAVRGFHRGVAATPGEKTKLPADMLEAIQRFRAPSVDGGEPISMQMAKLARYKILGSTQIVGESKAAKRKTKKKKSSAKRVQEEVEEEVEEDQEASKKKSKKKSKKSKKTKSKKKSKKSKKTKSKKRKAA